MSQVLLLLRNLVRWSGTSDPETLSDLDKNGFSGVKTLKPGWSGMKGEREQGNRTEPERFLKMAQGSCSFRLFFNLRWEEPEQTKLLLSTGVCGLWLEDSAEVSTGMPDKYFNSPKFI